LGDKARELSWDEEGVEQGALAEDGDGKGIDGQKECPGEHLADVPHDGVVASLTRETVLSPLEPPDLQLEELAQRGQDVIGQRRDRSCIGREVIPFWFRFHTVNVFDASMGALGLVQVALKSHVPRVGGLGAGVSVAHLNRNVQWKKPFWSLGLEVIDVAWTAACLGVP
jgi:hypothetical protein